MDIECPSCNLKNNIEHMDNIVCSGCKEPFSGHDHSYKKTKSTFIATCSALALGAYGSYKVDVLYFDKQRYPVEVEYELIDSCINSSSRIMRRSQYIEKKQLCLCALQKTIPDVDYEDLKKNESKFSTRFTDNIAKCI